MIRPSVRSKVLLMLRWIAHRTHFSAFFLSGLALFAAQAAAQTPAPAREATSRRPFVKPGAAKQLERVREFDVTHIKGEFTLDVKKGEIRGTVTHSITPLFPRPKNLPPGHSDLIALDCSDELEITKITINGEKAFGTKHNGGLLITDPPDKPFDLAITYSGSPPQGIRFVRPDAEHPDRPVCVWTQGEPDETHHWLPCYDYPNERATTEMIVTVDNPLSVVSNGALVEKKDNGDGTSTFHWKMETPHVSYLISIVASDFNIFRDQVGDLPVEYYVQKGVDEATARRAMGKTPKMIEFYNEKIGTPYKYPKYAQVCVPEFGGGMENISATTMTDSILRDPTASLENDADGIVAHELAHQWFGDLVTCRDWSNIWLNEGFASYFDPLFTEADRGEDAFRLAMSGDLRQYLGSDRQVRRAIVENRYAEPVQMFDSVTYAKGACVLHALRGLIGDEAWWKGIRLYVAKHKEQVVSTDDFRKAMELASGRDLGWFFDQWVYHGGHPELTASWRYEPEDGTIRLKVEQTQAVDDLTPLFRLPTEIQIGDDSGIRSIPLVIDGRSQEFILPMPRKPRLVRIDPKGWIPKELSFEKPTEEWVYQLENAPDALGRVEAARALAAKKDDKTAAEALLRAWPKETDPAVRLSMVRSVAQGGEAVRASLVAAAKDGDPKIRVAAIEALAGLHFDPTAETIFRGVWADKTQPYGARRASLRGLAKGKVKDRDDLLADALNDSSDGSSLAAEALRAIIAEGGPKAREACFRYSRPGQRRALRGTAIGALAGIARDDPQAEELLISLVDDPDRSARTAAILALSSGGFTSALPKLEERLSATRDLSRLALLPAVEALRRQVAAVSESNSREVADLERQAADLELQAKEMRNRAEALKLKSERAKLSAPKPAT